MNPAALTVLYDGACPLCRREISLYQGLTARQPVEWRDVSDPFAVLPSGGERATYLARFHVQRGSGEVLSGARAFVALWQVLPGWRWLGQLARLPGVVPVLEILYRFFLRFRPRLQRLAMRFEPDPSVSCACDPVIPSRAVVRADRPETTGSRD